MTTTSAPKVIVIGGGFTGIATAYDLSLRGFQVTLVERGSLLSGTSGRTHGLLHSGARYVAHDLESAVECYKENLILKRLMPDLLEKNDGLFVGIDDSDLAYAGMFEAGCKNAGIPFQQLTRDEALTLEPALTSTIQAAYRVEDAVFDPLRLAYVFAASAQAHGALFNPFNEMTGLITNSSRKVLGVIVNDHTRHLTKEVYADFVVNATGAWVGEVLRPQDISLPVIPTPGVMVAYLGRKTNCVINRLNLPGDGDILLPQRRMTVVGTTSYTVEQFDHIPAEKDQVDLMLQRGIELIPELATAPVRGIFTATRPLIQSGIGRSIARTFKCFDHEELDGFLNLVSISGGKATTLRLMAEKTSDLVCSKLGFGESCRTAETPLHSYREFNLTQVYS